MSNDIYENVRMDNETASKMRDVVELESLTTIIRNEISIVGILYALNFARYWQSKDKREYWDNDSVKNKIYRLSFKVAWFTTLSAMKLFIAIMPKKSATVYFFENAKRNINESTSDD